MRGVVRGLRWPPGLLAVVVVLDLLRRGPAGERFGKTGRAASIGGRGGTRAVTCCHQTRPKPTPRPRPMAASRRSEFNTHDAPAQGSRRRRGQKVHNSGARLSRGLPRRCFSRTTSEACRAAHEACGARLGRPNSQGGGISTLLRTRHRSGRCFTVGSVAANARMPAQATAASAQYAPRPAMRAPRAALRAPSQ